MVLNLFNNSLSNPLARKQKIKLFLIFIIISFLFWGITKFSKNYSALVLFDVKYENTPDLLIVESDYMVIEGYINTSGFQLLLYRLIPKTLKVDISFADFEKSKGTIDLTSQRRSLDDQIIGNFLSFENDQLYFNYSTLKTKKVKVNINTNFNYAPGYNSMNDSRIEPDSVTVSGPEYTLVNLNFLNTEVVEKDNISSNIKMIISIENNDSLLKIIPIKVLFEESIKRFTEQEFEIPIKVINLPDSIKIKLFPEKVNLTSSFPIEYIEKVKNEDFELVFDYEITDNGKFESVPVSLIKSSEFSRNIRWVPQTISYLIKK